MDLRLPDGSGSTRPAGSSPSARTTAILMLSMHDDDASVFDAMRAGARGYAIKGSDEEAVIGAVRAIARGEAIFGPRSPTGCCRSSRARRARPRERSRS